MMCLKRGILTAILVYCLSATVYPYDTYKISAELDTLNKQIKGLVEYTVPSDFKGTTFELQLYANVFSSQDSPFFKHRPEMLRRFKESNSWGGIEIDSVFIAGGKLEGVTEVEYTRAVISPDKQNNLGDKGIRIHFTTTIPEFGDRLSYTGNNYILDAWFPFPAILRSDGSWYQPNYNSFGELVGDFYNYDVTFAVPADFVVAASCSEEEMNHRDDGYNVYHYLFGPAHDFALVISPDYLMEQSSYDGLNINIYYRDFEQPMVSRVKNAAMKTLEYMSEYIGALDYKNLNYAFGDIGFAGGIEFPGLMALSSPRGGLAISNAYEELVIHETVHQWFYGKVASDQVISPWMDESITNLMTTKIFEKYWGEESNLLNLGGFKLSERDHIRTMARGFDHQAAVNQPTGSFTGGAQYFGTIYYRGALVLETFDNLLGDSLSSVFWKDYFRNNKFRLVNDSDFVGLVNELAGDTMVKIIDELLDSRSEIDYSVTNLSNTRIDSASYEISFILGRTAKLSYPIDYAIFTASGDTLYYLWYPEFNSEEIIIRNSSPAVTVQVDPRNKFTIDADLLNNSVSVQTDNKPGFRLSSGLMFLLESLFSFIGGI